MPAVLRARDERLPARIYELGQVCTQRIQCTKSPTVRGDYGLMWRISVGLGVFAALLHWRIRERPVPRLAIAEGLA